MIIRTLKECESCEMLVSREFFTRRWHRTCAFCHLCHIKKRWLLSPQELYLKYVAKDPLQCDLCAGLLDCEFGELTLGNVSFDHIIPRSMAGSWKIYNLAFTHRECNQRKGNLPHYKMRRVLRSGGQLACCPSCLQLAPARSMGFVKRCHIRGNVYWCDGCRAC